MKKMSKIKSTFHKRLNLFGFTGILLASLATSVVQAGRLLDEMQVPDTCGTDYAEKLASCMPFRCTKPSPMAMAVAYPSEQALKKMPAKQQQRIRQSMAAAEKKLAAMSPEKIATMKARMVSNLEINGFDAKGRCQTSTIAIPGQRMDCALDKSLLKQFVDYTRLAAGAERIQVKSESHLVNGKMVTEQVDVIDGKAMSNPWKQALDKGQCQFLEKNAAGAWVALNENIVTIPAEKPVKKITDSDSSTLFILDASGSMWGQINGKAKITIAKEVMAELVPELADSSRIGLIAYGHRRKADCNDVEVLVKLGSHHNKAVLSAVQGLSAKGKTPLTRSVNRAFKMLQMEKKPATIILVSDGIESCNQDPCKAVKAAKKYGINFVLHTVGFGLSKAESKQLQCMAKAGGGQYFQANNAKELLKSTRKALQPMGGIRITAKVNGKVTDVMLKIVDADSGKVVHENVLPSPSGMTTKLMAGKYNITVKPAGVNGAEGKLISNFEIGPGQVFNKTIKFGKGRLKLSITRNGKPVHASIHIEEHASHQWVYQSSVFGVDTPITVDLPAGKYDIVFQADTPERRLDNIVITDKKTLVKNIPVDIKPATGKNKQMAFQENTDRPGGGDFKHTIPIRDDAKLCQQACNKAQQCRAWTYVKPNTIQGNKPNCWLKQSAPAAVPNNCCISGVKGKQ